MTEEIYTKDSLLELAHLAVNYATSKGVQAAEAFFHSNRRLQILAEGQSIANERDVFEIGFGIRVIKEESEGFSYTNKIDKKDLEICAEDAIGIASVAPKKEGLRFPFASDYPTIEGLYSPQISAIETEEMVTKMKEILAPIKEAKSNVNANLSNIAIEEDWYGIVNSLGVEAFRKSNEHSGVFFAAARDGDKIGSFIIHDFYTRNPSSIDLAKFGEEVVELAERNLNTIVLDSIDSDIAIFKKGAIFFPLGIVISSAVGAHNVQQNRSMWKDKLADTVAVDTFNFIDDPHNLERGGGVKTFDDEGNATQKNTIIQNGILENFLFDELRASRVNAVSTGNSSRGFGGLKFTNPPSNIMPNAPTILPGDMSEKEMIEDTKMGIIFDRFSGSFRTENGMFSGVIKGAQLVKDGEIAQPLTNITIGGNVFEVLMNIVGLGKETDLINGFVTAPPIKVKGVNISTQK